MFDLLKMVFKFVALQKLMRKKRLILLKTLNGLRLGIRASFLLFVAAQVFSIGLGLTLYSLFQIFPMDPALRPYILLGCGILLISVPLTLVMILTSDRIWYQKLNSTSRSKNL